MFNQATLDKSTKEEKDIFRLERRILELEERVKSKRSNGIEFNQLKDYILTSHESHANSQITFYEKGLNFMRQLSKLLFFSKENR